MHKDIAHTMTTQYLVTTDGIRTITINHVSVDELRKYTSNGDPVIKEICATGCLDLIQQIVEDLDVSCSNREYFNIAAEQGHLDLFKYLKEKYSHTIRKNTVACAIRSGCPALVAYIHDTCNVAVEQEHMSMAVSYDQFDVAEYYFHTHGLLPTPDDMSWLAGRYGGDFEVFKKFFKAYGVQPTSEVWEAGESI